MTPQHEQRSSGNCNTTRQGQGGTDHFASNYYLTRTEEERQNQTSAYMDEKVDSIIDLAHTT